MDEPSLELEYAAPYEDLGLLYTDVDRNLVVVLEAYAADGIVPACRKGCDACCHQLLLTTVAEARVAAGALAALPQDLQARIDARLQAWLTATHDQRQALQAASDEDLDEVVEGLASGYWQARLACPFLEDHACAIHEARPLVCRHHFAVGDPAACSAPEAAAISRMEAMDDAFFLAQDQVPGDLSEIGLFQELVILERRE